MLKNTWKTIFIILLVVTIGFALLAVLLDWLPTHFPPKGAPATPASPASSTAPPTPAAPGTANSPASLSASHASAPRRHSRLALISLIAHDTGRWHRP